MDLKDKRVTVIGLSESGVSAARLLKRVGARVRISESRDGEDVMSRLDALGGVESEIGKHTEGFIRQSDLIVTSPGVPSDSLPLAWAKAAGITVIAELELGYRFCRAPIIAVTGTNGKSTTVSLIHEMLESNGIKSHLLGNIGRPFCEDALDAGPRSVVTLEVSSFQLEAISRFRPRVAVMLNFTQDHLDRYGSMEEYRKAKFRVFENQGRSDCAVLNFDDRQVRAASAFIKSDRFYFSLKDEVRGAYVRDGRIYADLGGGPERLCRIDDVNLPGTHNLENALAAIVALKLTNGSADASETLKSFRGLPHRFELVAERENVRYIDDSKSTTVDSTLRALEGYKGSDIILIAGGRDKGSDYKPVRNLKGKIKHFILIGEARSKIKEVLTGLDVRVQEAGTMEEAVALAREAAKTGDTVLLSPMCSSFDLFRDYKDRGDAFRAAVLDKAAAAK